jgi:ketosteroid isomerase-like protein
LFVFAGPGATASEVALPPDLARAAADYDAAQLKGDGAALQRLLADDYVLVNGAAQIENKREFIADSTAAGFKLEPFVLSQVINRVWNDGAALSGEVTLKGTADGKAFSQRMRFVDVWRRQRGV